MILLEAAVATPTGSLSLTLRHVAAEQVLSHALVVRSTVLLWLALTRASVLLLLLLLCLVLGVELLAALSLVVVEWLTVSVESIVVVVVSES